MNVGTLHLRSSPPISGICLKLSIVDGVVRARIYRSSISFDFVDSSSSCFVDLRLIAGFPRFLLAFATSLEYPRIFLYSRAFCQSTPRRWNTRGCWIPAFLLTCVSLQSSRVFVDLREQASISRVYDLPRLSRWSYINIESLDWSYRFPDRSGIG